MARRSVYLLAGTLLWVISCLSVVTQKTYYDTLDVQKTATDRQIKKAFHKLAVKFHPDKNKSSEAEVIFREIVEAYEVLSNQDSRRIYDYLGHEAFLQDEKDFLQPEEHPDDEAFFHFDFDDFFSSLDQDEAEDLFMDAPHPHGWGFPPGGEEDMDELHVDQQILDHIFFDTREHHYYYGAEDEDESENYY